MMQSCVHGLANFPRNARELPKSYIVHPTSYIGSRQFSPLRGSAYALSIRTYRPLRVRPQRGRRACCTSYFVHEKSRPQDLSHGRLEI